jgi:hypothetical protein
MVRKLAMVSGDSAISVFSVGSTFSVISLFLLLQTVEKAAKRTITASTTKKRRTFHGRWDFIFFSFPISDALSTGKGLNSALQVNLSYSSSAQKSTPTRT